MICPGHGRPESAWLMWRLAHLVSVLQQLYLRVAGPQPPHQAGRVPRGACAGTRYYPGHVCVLPNTGCPRSPRK